MIFLDRQCHACHGNGCDQCHGTGMIGDVRDVHVSNSMPDPNSFAERMREWRLKHGRTFRELSAETGILPSVLSGIENGQCSPDHEQMQTLEGLMYGGRTAKT